jgi:non-ribosomal peptide synthetase component F
MVGGESPSGNDRLLTKYDLVFTPLFLGAQLLVPSRSDIAHERLAEWMAKYTPTVTHLTPASMSIIIPRKDTMTNVRQWVKFS